jgi:ATP-binding cassette subfamily F protein 3
MQNQLNDAEKSSDVDFIFLLQKKQHELEQKIYEWELLNEELEKFNEK